MSLLNKSAAAVKKAVGGKKATKPAAPAKPTAAAKESKTTTKASAARRMILVRVLTSFSGNDGAFKRGLQYSLTAAVAGKYIDSGLVEEVPQAAP